METNEASDSTTIADPTSEVLETETKPNEPIEVSRLSYRSMRDKVIIPTRDNWLRLKPQVQRDTHPMLYPRKMICKRIEQITRTDHGTYKVLIRRHVEDVEYAVLDCRTILNIVPNEKDPSTIIFVFEEYFTDEQQFDLHLAFLDGRFDDLGDMPEF